MGSPKKNQNKGGFFAAMSSGLSMFGNAMHRSINGYVCTKYAFFYAHFRAFGTLKSMLLSFILFF